MTRNGDEGQSLFDYAIRNLTRVLQTTKAAKHVRCTMIYIETCVRILFNLRVFRCPGLIADLPGLARYHLQDVGELALTIWNVAGVPPA